MAQAYIEIARVDPWRIVRHSANGNLYVAWYDANVRQTKRRSLSTKSVVEAVSVVSSLVDRRIEGDPIKALTAKPLLLVREVLAWHRAYAETLASCDAETIAINAMISSDIGDRSLRSLVLGDFEGLRDVWVRAGISISTVSRRLSTLRSAIRRAVDFNVPYGDG